MIMFLLTIILLPITIYCIKKKPEFPTDTEYDRIEREVKEWLKEK